MTDWKILILPELYEEVNTGWPLSVVFNIWKSDLDKRFIFINKPWKIERHNINKTNIIKKYLKKIWLLRLLDYFIYFLKTYFKIISKIKFQKYCISHEIFYSFLMLIFNKVKYLVTVIHSQWNIYNENINLWWVWKSFFLKTFLEYIEFYVFKRSIYVWFPSNWAFEGFLTTSNEKTKKLLLEYKQKWKVKIFYNWVNLEQEFLLNDIFEKKSNEIIFSTVSTLNYEKWVDRIPSFLNKLKESWLKFHWILIWNWFYLEKIQKDIKEYNLESNVSIYNKPFKKNEIIWLFRKSDFYIMFHRLSVFDYATLEAMNEWNIPLLSNIWWNKEVCIDNNWFLLNDEDIENWNFEKVIQFINNININNYKNKNKEIISKNFSENNFIERYYWIIDELLILK